MTDPTEMPPPAAARRSFRGWLADMPRWKKISVLAAGALVVTGTVLVFADPGAAVPADPAAGGSAPAGTLGSSLAGDPAGGEAIAAPVEPASKGFFRLGFSFIAGFCLGSFVRATLRVAAIAVGFWLLMTIALSYCGLVDVNWQGIESLWGTFLGAIEAEWANLRVFVTGSLPAAGLVATGFAIGMKRH